MASDESNDECSNPLGTDLSLKLIRDGLSCLGKHPLKLRHAYLGFSAEGENIRGIENIQSYPNLMYVNLSNNLIETLKPLENLTALVQLKARNNLLRDCLLFSPKKCTAENAWPDGQKAVGSMLAMADLTGNRISEIGNLEGHKFLECLMLGTNRITMISGLQNLRYLQILDLSYNKLTRIEALEGLLLNELNLEGNYISSLKGLADNPRLTVLNIANNRIAALAPLALCLELRNLNVSRNRVKNIRQVEFLKELRWFRFLNLSENPCCMKTCYRARVSFRLQLLQQLDETIVSSEEKIRANNLYGSEGGDLQHRQDTMNKYFPDESIEDYIPFFEDDEMDIKTSELINDSVEEVFFAEDNSNYEEVKSMVGVILRDIKDGANTII